MQGYFLSLLDEKVEEICEGESEPKYCRDGFKTWKVFIDGFIRRTLLRVAQEIDPANNRGINVDLIPETFSKLAIGVQSESSSCVMCEYLVESACEMITGQGRNAHIGFACLVESLCMQILYKKSAKCPPSDPDNITDPQESNCWGIGTFAAGEIYNQITNFTNNNLWPKACHLVNKNCQPKTTGLPMCQGGPPVPNGSG